MNEILDANLDDEIIGDTISDKDLLLGIIKNPRKVFRYLQDKSYDRYVLILLILSGIFGYADRSFFFIYENYGDLAIKILKTIIIGGVLGIVSNYVFAFLLSIVGGWLKGIQNTKAILRILAYSTIPAIFGILPIGLQILFFSGSESGFARLYRSNSDLIVSGVFTFIYISSVFIWPLILLVIGISEIQKFSILKSFLSLLPALVIFAFLGVISFIFIDMFSLSI